MQRWLHPLFMCACALEFDYVSVVMCESVSVLILMGLAWHVDWVRVHMLDVNALPVRPRLKRHNPTLPALICSNSWQCACVPTSVLSSIFDCACAASQRGYRTIDTGWLCMQYNVQSQIYATEVRAIVIAGDVAMVDDESV